MQQTATRTLGLNVSTGTKAVLTAADLTYLGSYILTNFVGEGITFGAPITHRYVGDSLRFLITSYNNGAYDLVEFALPAGAFGQTIGTRTNRWPGAAVWAFRPPSALQGHHHGFWWEDQGGGTGRFWESFGIDYPGSPSQNMTLGLATCTLNNDGTVSNYRSCWGFQGVSQRCIMGKVQKNPVWFQQQYGVGPYLYGFGGYSSLLIQGGTTSLGLFAIAGPDVTLYPPTAGYPPAGYVNGSGGDWNIPATDFSILADHRTGTISGTDWYASGSPTTKDRGARITVPINYYDGGSFGFNTAGTATFTHGSTTVTFSQAQTLNAGDWLTSFATGGTYLVASSVVNSLSVNVTVPYADTTNTSVARVYRNPPNAPLASGQWLSPAPDGKSRWVWGDSYFSTGTWIDGPNRTGLVCVGNFGGGKCWYHTPGNSIGSDHGNAEIHVFDPTDLGAVKQGTKQPWNVQPSAMKDITGDLTPFGICVSNHVNESNGPTGASFDPTTGRLWVFSTQIAPAFGGNGYNCLLSCYQCQT